jgi:Ca2+-binding RTX toxin-like protein
MSRKGLTVSIAHRIRAAKTYASITGTSGNDLLFGSSSDDSIAGGLGDDDLYGLRGNDILVGGAGNDLIDGGVDIDIAVYSGNRSDYTVTFNVADQSYTVTDNRAGSPDGTDILNAIEIVRFADGDFSPAAIINHAPTGINLARGTIAENSAAGTVVGTLSGVDPDAKTVFAYSLINDAGGRFVVDAKTGVISVKAGAIVDYETTRKLPIIARVTDQDGLSFDKALTITLTNVSGNIGGTNGNDSLTGTTEEDTISGGAGDDTIVGLTGNDTISGGAGNDAIDGWVGTDTVILTGNLADYKIAWNTTTQSFTITDRVADRDGVDTVKNVENFNFGGTVYSADAIRPRIPVGMGQYIFSSVSNGVTWTDARKLAQGLGGDLVSINSKAEDDLLKDILYANLSFDIYDGYGAEYLGPWIGLYQQKGSAEPYGGWVWTDGSDTTVYNGWFSSEPDNSFGNEDFAHYLYFKDRFALGWNDLKDDPVIRTIPVPKPISFITELAATQTSLTGTAGVDYIIGGSIANVISGLGGNDTIDGGGGNDTLTGSDGADMFVYSARGFGKDVIIDFTATGAAQDTLRIAPSLFADWRTLLSATKQVGSDLVITASANDTITLKNITLASFTQQDVVFGG